jgi:hypothetical protein
MITSMKRDYGVNPAIVRISATDDIDTITTAGYIGSQASVIQQLNGGTFQWEEDDYILISYDDSWGFFLYTIDSDQLSSAPLPLIAGTGITISQGLTGMTISSSDAGENWSVVVGTTQAASVGMGYITANAAQTTVTLPATAAAGSVVAVAGLGAAGWVLAANAGQTIQSAVGGGNTVTSAEQYDTINVVCLVANTTWSILSSSTTGFTIA